jgi:exopolysaccharide biosynthesis protein
MKSLNCIDALNLDGGGSTLLYGNNKILNKYSDAVPRPVVSAVLVRDRNKKRRSLPLLVKE